MEGYSESQRVGSLRSQNSEGKCEAKLEFNF